ncbi:MAG TPA: BamA/TamA family outer membrane protein [Stellaceae bacterium]|nr:BamA/TamA family outer membrane protein [Stellaceae bacterium]
MWCRQCVIALVAVGGFAVAAHAADPQPYKVTITATGDKALDGALNDASQLVALKDKSPVGPFALVARAKGDIDRLQTVLNSFGYYEGKATITIDGRSVDDTTLVSTLDAVPKGQSVEVKAAIGTGPLYHLRKIEIRGAVPPDAYEKLGLKPDQPAKASDVLAGGTNLLTGLEEEGFALAKVDPPQATADPQTKSLDVVFNVTTGRRATIGKITLAGLEHMNESFVRRRLLVREGQLYQPSKIEAARQDLLTLGVFSGVSVKAGDAIAPDGSLPITFDIQERPLHAVGVTGAYSTDLGAEAKLTWSDRNLFGNAEQLNLSAAMSGLGGTATTGLGYDITGQFVKPDFLRRDQSLEFNAAALQQDLQAYHQRAFTAGPSLHRKFSPLWSGSVGVTGEEEHILQEHVSSDYTLLALPLTANFDSTGLKDPTLDPTHGARGAFTVTPTESLGKPTTTFAVLQVSGSTYVDLDDLWNGTAGRSILAFRGLIGSIEGATQFALPPDQRFYGGGSGTVRGFKYQSVGPLFPDNNPMGGAAIDAGTVEFRQRLFDSFGAAVFVDGGQVSADNTPFSGTVRIGTGAGLRYYTPIGPVRLDVAVPVNRPPGGDAFEFYLGLGQAF